MVMTQIALIVAISVALLSSVAEVIHLRRTHKLADLAFGAEARARGWTRVAPVIRVIALTLLGWGFTILLMLNPLGKLDREVKESEYRRVVILLDASPSMQIKDGGVPIDSEGNEQQTRAQRGAEVVDSLMKRLYQDEMRYTVVAFYTGAITVVKDTKDASIVTNIMQDLPIIYAFRGGETDLFAGLEKTFSMAKDWLPQSTTVIMVTDGDSIPASGMPKMPNSIHKFLVVGVGSATTGSEVHDHVSRQDTATLRELAARLGGDYQDANTKQLSSSLMSELTSSAIKSEKVPKGYRAFSRYAVLTGSLMLLILPVMLEKFGFCSKGQRTERRRLKA